MRGKRTVRGVEYVMTFVEYIADRWRSAADLTTRRLDHNQCVVGDHKIGVACAPYAAFDEAARIVRARGVDTFTSSIGQTKRPVAANQVAEPGREVTTIQIAVARFCGPARHKT